MTNLAQIALPELPVEGATFSADPYTFVREAKTKRPWLATPACGLPSARSSCLNTFRRYDPSDTMERK